MKHFNDYNMENRGIKKLLIGLLFIIAGGLLLAFNLGFLPDYFRHIFFSWQMLLIAIGAIQLLTKQNRLPGMILITVGVVFIMPRVLPFDVDLHNLFWPVVLFAVGLLIISGMNRRRWHEQIEDFTGDSGYIHETNIFGGGKRRLSPVVFKGGDITNIFGGMELDLTQTTLSEGKNVIDVTCIFGGFSLIVPEDWIVHLEVASVFGGFSDKRIFRQQSTSFDSPKKELFVKGAAIFGGGEVKTFPGKW